MCVHGILLIALQIPCIALCQACEAATPSQINLDSLATFESDDLGVEFRRLNLSVEGPIVADTDSGPPSKRRRLDGGGADVLERITSRLETMLQGPQVAE